MIIALLALSSPAHALDPQAERAKAELGMDPALAQRIRDGLELLYRRDYDKAREHFKEVERTAYPNSGLGAMSDVLVWQALMMENFDYRFEKQYWVSSKEARKQLEAALKIPGNDSFEHFLMAGVSGIESIHLMRNAKYLTALQHAFEALDHIQATRQLTPQFTDLKLADGMYNYWRTVVTKSSSILPDFGDHRAEGLVQMQAVEKDGIFLAMPTTLALSFTYLEENKKAEAKAACERIHRQYPSNIINNMVYGSIHVSENRYDAGLVLFDQILADAPKNRRVHYWRGIALQRSGRLKEAETAYNTYLAVDYMEQEQRAQTHYRMGQIHYNQKLYAQAEADWKAALKEESGHSRSKEQLNALRAKVKSGEITY